MTGALIFLICALLFGLGLLIYGAYLYGYNVGWKDREAQYLSRPTIKRLLEQNGIDR